jgi:putative ABC transport system permease protein
MIIETIDVTPPTAPSPQGLGRLFSSSFLLVRRRAWRDRGPLTASVVVVALASMLALAGPEVVLTTIDDGARDAVESVGDAADITVTFPVGNMEGDNVNSMRGTDPSLFEGYATDAATNLPGVVAPLIDGHSSYVLSRQLMLADVLAPLDANADLSDVDRYNATINPDLWDSRLTNVIQFAISGSPEWSVVQGRLPIEATGSEVPIDVRETVGAESVTRLHLPGEIIEVAMTPSVADALDVQLGSILRVENAAQNRVTLRVVGLVEPADPSDPAWDAVPEAIEGVFIDKPGIPLYRRGTVMVSEATANAITDALEQPFNGTIVLDVGSDGLTLAGAREIERAMRTLETTANSIVPAPDVNVSMTSGLAPALAAYPARAHAALAQMSITVAGVIGVAAVVVALMARLLLSRRDADIALERARGASVASIALRLGIESAVFTLVGVTLGYVAALAVVGTVSPGSASLFAVACVALLSAPMLGTFAARRMWTSRRVPANRHDRARLARAKAARRYTIEALAVVLAITAVITLRGRTVLQTQTSGIDPFLASAPILLALGITVIVLRLYPIPMAAIQAMAKRTRGIAGIITLAKARGRIPVLPLLGLSLAISIAVSGGLLVSTVRNGQEIAAWERVGGDVRIDAAVSDATVTTLEAEGFDVSRLVARPYLSVNVGTTSAKAYLLVIDDEYVTMLESSGRYNPTDLRALLAAAEAAPPGSDIPALISPSLSELAFTDTREAFLGGHFLDFDIVGDAVTMPIGWAEGPFLVLPAEALLSLDLDSPVEYTLAFVSGEGAAEAVAATDVVPSTVTTRDQWLDGVRDSALIGGVEKMMTMAVIAVALLAAVALLVTILEGVRQRGIALSLLRTQGMSSRYGWWLALTELAPLTIAAVIGGTGGGLAVLLLLGQTLGLDVLAGGVSEPPLVPDVPFLCAVALGVVALLIAAVSAEVTAHRRNKLSEVLRLGDTR